LSRSHRITLSGLDFIPDLSGALFVPEFKALLVADLHLEKGTSLARRGVHLPPYDTRESLLQLQAAVEATKPRRLIFLGDSFHDGDARERIDTSDLALLRAITARAETVWITGNHDAALKDRCGGMVVEEAVVDGLVLRHEADRGDDRPELSGHFHPKLRIHVRGKQVARRCFVATPRKIVLPAFGALTGGLDVDHPALVEAVGQGAEALIPVDQRLLRFPIAA